MADLKIKITPKVEVLAKHLQSQQELIQMMIAKIEEKLAKQGIYHKLWVDVVGGMTPDSVNYVMGEYRKVGYTVELHSDQRNDGDQISLS